MLELISDFSRREEFMPYGTCFLWYPEILYTQAVSDVITGISYFSVAIGFIYFFTQREDIPFKWFFMPFGSLVFAACGTVHFLGAWTLWTPDFGIQTVFKVITAMVSLSVGVIIWPLMPRIIALPSPRQFAAAKLELVDTKIRRAEEAMDESEERFRDFAENAADWFWETDADLRFSYITGKFEEVLGMKLEEIIGKDPSELYHGSSNRDNPLWKELSASFNNHIPFSNIEYPWYRPDSVSRTISVSGTPRFDAENAFAGYRGVGRDITEQIQLEEQVRRAQKMEAVGQLTSGIAHDFNNILGIIQGNFEILQKVLKDNDKAKPRIEAGLKGTARGAALTRKLLDFSRTGTSSIQRISINGFIQDMEDLIVKSLTVSISFKLHLDDETWLVDIGAGDLQDVIINLALNARDAMPDGGNLVIETRNKVLDEKYAERTPGGKAGEFVMLSVSDTGHGMTAAVKEHVLEPFFTTKEQGKGTGLGLSMVYGFVRRSGGHLEIYSEPGKGTTIHLYLPRAMNELAGNQAAEMIETGRLPTGTGTILVVEDEEDLREIAVLYLESLGYQTRTAENGDNALQVLSDGHVIDLLFSDVIMPGEMDGYQLAVTAHERYPELKVLLTSGFTKKRSKLRSAEDKYLVNLNDRILDKPYNLTELANALQNTMDRQE
jgi:PAS domain S-box-containing protein